MSNKLFSKIKAQVSIYLISIIVVLIILTFAVINVGKIFKDKTYADNAADGGALAAATVMATAFNYNADSNSDQKEGGSQHEWSDYDNSTGDGRPGPDNKRPSGFGQVQNLEQVHRPEQKATHEFVGSSGAPAAELAKDFFSQDVSKRSSSQVGKTPGFTKALTQGGTSGTFIPYTQSGGIRGNEDAYTGTSDNEQESRKEATDADEPGQNDYYNNALVAGYKYNFYNAGIFHRLGRINARRFSQFLEEITPETVQNGEPKTFFWIDGAFRIHTVTAIIEIEPADNYVLRVQQNGRQTQEGLEKGAVTEYEAAGRTHGSAGGDHTIAQDPLEYWWAEPSGDGLDGAAFGQDEAGLKDMRQWDAGKDGSKSIVTNKSNQDDQEIIKFPEDIVHSQTVYSSNLQMHMGGVIKGMRGDIDFLGPSFYPPVQSSAIASFNCKQSGEIYKEGGGSSASFEACLIATH